MPLIIVINVPNKGKIPTPHIVSRDEVRNKARESGVTNPQKASSVTIPVLNIDKSGFGYKNRKRIDQKRILSEFSFHTGPLWLTLKLEIYMAKELSSCARDIWKEHEADHVRDYTLLMQKLKPEIEKNTAFQAILSK